LTTNIAKIQFWLKHLNWFIPFVSEFYPLNKFQLLQYEDLWDWDRIKSNTFITWTEQIKDCFKDKLNTATATNYLTFEVCYGDPVVNKYPSADEIYLRQEDKSQDKIFWKDINFGIHNIGDACEDDVKMKLIWEFKCSMDLNYQLFKERPLTANYIENKKFNIEWKLLSRYFGLEWSFELLQQFEIYWITEQLICNQHLIFV